VIGRFKKAKGKRQKAKGFVIEQIRNPQSAIRNPQGFSLLELMIAMFILIILMSVAVPVYRVTVQNARETVLKENLWQMRRAIDQYAADKGKLPSSLDDLVTDGYLREKPIDPITEKAEWDPVMGENLNPDDGQGLKDIKSLAEGEDSDGKKYQEY
jgi:general secretion pathway protein G